jgi:hypothetical protein
VLGIVGNVEFEDVETLRREHPAWKLLRADNAPLILSFLGRVFVEGNARVVPAVELTARLDDYLFALNERLGEGTFPKSAKAYLDDWAGPGAGWLRKYYPPGSDEQHFDATPAVEKAVAWIASLRSRPFVGTESRLNTVFELLRQMAVGAETDRDVRLEDLKRRREQLDAEIARVESGDVRVLDDTALRDRYQQFSETARGLLADFREVEANFRQLDRELRERIAVWDGAKGELVERVVGDRSAIADSDQGRSFHAFYDFLLSRRRQEEFTELLEKVRRLDAIGDPDPRMRHIHYDWLAAGERTQATVRLLSEQLRRFLDDQVWLENRRVMDILKSIEGRALKLRGHAAAAIAMEIDAPAPDIALPFERPMYRPKAKVRISGDDIADEAQDVDVSLLFEQTHVDPARLSAIVRSALRGRAQADLAQVIAEHPIEEGLAELVTYLSLTDPAFRVVFDDDARAQASWQSSDGGVRVADIPRATFARTDAGEG